MNINKHLKLLNLVLILGVLMLSSCHAQNTLSRSLKSPEGILQISFDNLGQQYILGETMTLYKMKNDSTIWNRYINNRLGTLTVLDVANPLRLLAYYQQFQTLICLDNNLAESGVLNFNNLGFGYVRAVCISEDNNIWILDEYAKSLKKIDPSGKVLQEGIPDFNLRFDPDKPITLKARDAKVYLFQPNLGLLVYDVFGNRISTDLTSYQNVTEIWQGKLFDVTEKGILIYDLYNIISPPKIIEVPDRKSSIFFNLSKKEFQYLDEFNQIRKGSLPVLE